MDFYLHIVAIFLCLFLLPNPITQISADDSSSTGPCPSGEFLLSGQCKECHCYDQCTCLSGIGCSCPQDVKYCEVGYTGYPQCQEELPTPTANDIQWDSETSTSIVIQIKYNFLLADNAYYDFQCTDHRLNSTVQTFTLKNAFQQNKQLTISPQSNVTCVTRLVVKPDRSLAYQFTATPCSGWVLPDVFLITVDQVYDGDKILRLNITWPNTDAARYSLDILDSMNSSLHSETTFTTSVTFDDSRHVFQPGSSYTINIEAFDILDFTTDVHLATYQQQFTINSLTLPFVSASSITYQQSPGRIDLEFPLWNPSMNNASLSPDAYFVEYRKYVTDYPLEWTRTRRCRLFGDKMVASIEITNPGETYEIRTLCQVHRGNEYVEQESPDSIHVKTLPCGKPSDVILLNDVEFGSQPDTVVVKMKFTEADANCNGFVTYTVLYRKYSGTLVEERDCGNDVNYCELDGIDANSRYYAQIKASNQAGNESASNFINFETPKKTPFLPSNIAVKFNDNLATVEWSPPAVNRGDVDLYRVVVMNGSRVLKNVTSHVTSIQFTGRYYKDYPTTIRPHNSVGWGQEASLTVKIPETYPGVVTIYDVSLHNETCADTYWMEPRFDGGIIRSYKIRCSLVLTYSNNTISALTITNELPEATYRPHRHVICDLLPGSLFNCTITAKNNKGEGPLMWREVWTAPSKPYQPSSPVIVRDETTDTTLTLILPLADKRDGPARWYYLGVEKIGRRKRSVLANLTSDDFPPFHGNYSRRYMTAKLRQADVGRRFTVGDGKSYNGVLNPPLQKDETYVIYYGVEITRGGVSKQTFVRLREPVKVSTYVDPDFNRQLVTASIAAGVTLVLFIGVLLIVIFIIKRRNEALKILRHQAELVPLSTRGTLPDSADGRNGVVNIKPISVSHLKSFIEVHQDDIAQQYRALPSGLLAPVTAGLNPSNKAKNRFIDILPYDHSRVILTSLPGKENSHYINASYIDGYKTPKKYIAASGPNETTCYEFWRMVMEQNSQCIVMVTKCVECGLVKCEKYWPDEEQTKTYEDITITCTSSEKWADFDMRTFEMSQTGVSNKHIVYQFHFVSWPDHGVPDSSAPFLLFRHRVMSFYKSLTGPLILHCSAGVGRSGTFIAIDYLLDQAADEGHVDVFSLVQKLRQQRTSMVQTEDQYFYVYSAVCEALLSSTFCSSATYFRDNYVSNELEFDRRMEEQLEALKEFTVVNETNFEVGAEKENNDKNQDYSILPHDMHRAYIISQPKGYGTYINAILVNSYRMKRFFVTTQIPLTNTVDDYLRLLYDRKISTVVSLEPYSSLSDSRYGQFCSSSKDAPLETNLFTVTLNEINDPRANIVVSNLTIKYKPSPGKPPHTLKYFHANFWGRDDPVPESADTFITLLELVDKSQQVVGAKNICVQCRDGNLRSGVFMAVCNALDRLKTEQEVDVFNTVKLLRMVRPQFIVDLVQYKFVHDVLHSYLQEFDLYENYH